MRHEEARWDDYDGPYEGVPPWLTASLVEWIEGWFWNSFSYASEHVKEFNRYRRVTLSEENSIQWTGQVARDEELLLDAVDFVLQLRLLSPDSARELSVMLGEAGSLYTLGLDADGKPELQDRITAEAMTLGDEVMSVSDRASQHLRAAWSKAFGRDKDPTGAHDHAIKAVEVLAAPIVIPKDGSATLGKILRAMEAKPEKWSTKIDAETDVERVIAMMRLLWESHYRHGDETKPMSNSEASAEAMVQLAVVLVQWLRSGSLYLV